MSANRLPAVLDRFEFALVSRKYHIVFIILLFALVPISFVGDGRFTLHIRQR
jgi:hypothetical protein